MKQSPFALSCPVPHPAGHQITLAHGSGGTAMERLLESVFFEEFQGQALQHATDAAVLAVDGARLAFTTDAFVVQPFEFPGGNIGSLAVHGTVNDLAMAGARPLYLSVAFILEEGLPIEALRRVVRSLREAAEAAQVHIVTGDTKVVERGKGDGIYLTTTGIGIIEHGLAIAPAYVRDGDAIVINGDLGRHGMAIMAEREGLDFESTIMSDSAPLAAPVLDLLAEGIEVHCLRDLTRGGLASALNEIAAAASCAIHVHESQVPVRDDVRGMCELLGFDVFHVANEGRFAAFVPAAQAEAALAVLRRHAIDTEPARIGAVHPGPSGRVTVESAIGIPRMLDKLSGEQLPRIC